MILKPETREGWLELRKEGIGGSDAGAVIGLNTYKSNVDLWKEKTGIITPPDLSDNPSVQYGKQAESHLREMFKLDFPQYNVEYHEFWMYLNEDNPFIFATLDGELTERETGRKGILEIKTTEIKNKMQWDEWDNRIPDHYYAQVLHQLIATGFDFVIVKAHIRYYKGNDLHIVERHPRIERKDVLEDMQILLEKEISFWESVQKNKEPALILPNV